MQSMKTTLLIVVFLCTQSLIVAGAEKPSGLPVAKITVQTVDEQAKPVAGVPIHFVFMNPITYQPLSIDGFSDEGGFFSAEGGSDSTIAGEIRKAGYYRGGFPLEPFVKSKEGHWQPWNQTNVVLMRKIENPIPMYAKNFFLKVPQIGKPCGYDLAVGDWMSPWGKGRVPDFVFTMTCDYTNFNHQNTSMKLTFSNPLDGIQPADLPKEFAYGEFIWHRQSPESGYVGSYEQELGLPRKLFQIPSAPKVRSGEDIEAQKFYFRVRTVEKEGKVVSALYGKLSRGFGMGATNPTNINVGTCYYLNPTPLDRNMEFDLKQNLFKNLKVEEQPRKP